MATVLQRYRGRLDAVPRLRGAAVEHAAAAADAITGRPSGGRAHCTRSPVKQGGMALAVLRQAPMARRSGGERFQRAPGTPPRSLKKQFQAAGVPAWQRDAPLLYAADGRLLFVPGLGIDARALAAAGEPQCALSWVRQP